jgi:ubiquinone/menaquinone biosynthesis C-methylase UbiE
LREGNSVPDIQRELHGELGRGSPARLGFTRKAFQMLPDLDNPSILDVGCGQGGPTLELARLSGGQLTGLDIDQSVLDDLARRADEEGLSDRVQVVHGSMTDMDFPDESFDVIWAEGSMHVVGFERALGMWRRFIRPRGFLVVHEMAWLRPDPPSEIADCPELAYPGIRTIPEYAELVPSQGYDLVGHFALPVDFWLLDYFDPMMDRLRRLRKKYADDQAAQRTLDREARAADLYRQYSEWYGSAFLVMQKRERED